MRATNSNPHPASPVSNSGFFNRLICSNRCRSSTIIFALLLGLGRGPAVEFSFLLGVPTLCAAGAKTMLDALKHHEVILWQPLIIATVVAAVSSVFAVRWLLRYVQSHTFTGFGLYRIALGVLLLVFVHDLAAH